MKLSNEQFKKIKTILSIAKLIDMDSFVIDGQITGGANGIKNAVLFSKGVFDFPERIKLGVSNAAILEKRLALFDNPEIEFILTEFQDYTRVFKFQIKEGKAKTEFRCTDYRLVKYPKEFHLPKIAEFKMQKHEVQFMSKAVKNMGAETLNINVNEDGKIEFSCADSSNNGLQMEFSNPMEFINDSKQLKYTYATNNTGVIIPVLSYVAAHSTGDIIIDVMLNGMLKVSIAEFDIYLSQRINHESELE